MPESNADNLRKWLQDCPAVNGSNRFGLDYLSDTPTEYALFAVPSTISYKENILGEMVMEDIQEENWIFASKEIYGQDALQNAANLVFHQTVASWILQQNNAQAFPEWDKGTIKSIIPTITAAPVTFGSSVAKYQIQIRITYRIA